METKCNKESYCTSMLIILPNEDNGKKGAHYLETVDIKSGKVQNAGIRYRYEKGKSLMFNYCPFCGAEIKFWDKENIV